jgi:hypothetical protein
MAWRPAIVPLLLLASLSLTVTHQQQQQPKASLATNFE